MRVNTTPHTSHFFNDLHAHAWFKSCVWRAHITCHVSSSCAHVVVLTLRDFSTFLSLLSIFSLIILSFLLPINFIFHDVVDKFPVHSTPDAETKSSWSYDMEGHAKKFVENLKIKRLSNHTKSQRHAWMTINLKKKKVNQCENCLLFAQKLF